jgi:acyl-CoA thioester hydrolase
VAWGRVKEPCEDTAVRVTFEPPTDPAAYSFVHRLRVRFAETDAMGVVHHGAYLPYLESARVEYLRSLGHPYAELRDEGIELPVIELALRYLRPVRFDDVVDVHLVVASSSATTLQLGYLVTADGTARATAVTVHGVVSTASGRPARAPGWLRELAASP